MFGPLVWAGHLTIVYGGHTLLCLRGELAGVADVYVLTITAAAVLILGAFVFRIASWERVMGLLTGEDANRTTRRTARLLAILSLIAVLWSGATVGLVAACVQGR
ncbi:hypothetical protein QW131_29680 [Roseibium salinum]|nr:hypothetical protein [Roseibium salinum]